MEKSRSSFVVFYYFMFERTHKAVTLVVIPVAAALAEIPVAVVPVEIPVAAAPVVQAARMKLPPFPSVNRLEKGTRIRVPFCMFCSCENPTPSDITYCRVKVNERFSTTRCPIDRIL